MRYKRFREEQQQAQNLKQKRKWPIERSMMIAKENIALTALCGQIFERNRETISIKNARSAIPNLCSIVTATLELSAEKGFEAMSLRDLSARSRLSMGALYSYFDSKETLARMIILQLVHTTRQVLHPALEARPRSLENARTVISTYVQLTSLMPTWFVFALVDMAKSAPELRTSVLQTEEAIELFVFDALRDVLKTDETTHLSVLAMLVRSTLAAWASRPDVYIKRDIGADEFAGGVTLLLDLVTGGEEALDQAMRSIQEQRIKFIYGI